jgi:hypothetical protein
MRFCEHSIQNKKKKVLKYHPFYQWFIDGYFEDQQESKCRPWWQLQRSVAQRKQNVLKNTRQS